MGNTVSEKITNFDAYHKELGRLPDLVDVELPTIEAPTDTVSGAGIAGEVESPVVGHISAMTVAFKFRNALPENHKLLAPKAHRIEVRASQQKWDASAGAYVHKGLKYVMDCVPKSTPLGTLTPGSGQETVVTMSVKYIKIYIDKKVYAEVDPYNYIFIIDGTDYLAAVRVNLGR